MLPDATHAGHRGGRGEAQGADEQPHVPGLKKPTHARRPKQQNEQEVGCLNIDFKESAGSRRRHVVFYQCMYPIAEPGAHMLWDGTASGGGMTRRCLK